MHSARRAQYFRRSHAVLAMLFLVVMLVEWGSHSLAFAHSGIAGGMIAVSSPQPEHDDPCRKMTECCQGRKHGGSILSPSHHLPSFVSFVESIGFVAAYSRGLAVPTSIREDVQRIFRPKDPLLHPPELS